MRENMNNYLSVGIEVNTEKTGASSADQSLYSNLSAFSFIDPLLSPFYFWCFLTNLFCLKEICMWSMTKVQVLNIGQACCYPNLKTASVHTLSHS